MIDNATLIHENATGSVVPSEKHLGFLVLFVLPIATIFGNTLVVLAILTQKSLKTSTNFLLLSLATADMLIGFVVVPFSIYLSIYNFQWRLGNIVCDFFIVCDVSLSTASIIHLMAISIDRFYAVVRHLEYRHPRHRRHVYVQISLAWLFSIGLGLPLGIGLNRRPQEGLLLCGIGNADFMLYGSIFAFILPSIVMIIMYGFVFYKLHLQLRAVRVQEAAASRMVNFGENLNHMITSTQGPEYQDIRARMLALAMPFLNKDQNSTTAEDDDDISVSSNDLEELRKILTELEQQEKEAMSKPGISNAHGEANQQQTLNGRHQHRVSATLHDVARMSHDQLRKVSRAARRLSGLVNQESRQSSTPKKSVRLFARSKLRNVKDRAFELIMKMRSKQGAQVRKETRATKLVASVMSKGFFYFHKQLEIFQ